MGVPLPYNPKAFLLHDLNTVKLKNKILFVNVITLARLRTTGN